MRNTTLVLVGPFALVVVAAGCGRGSPDRCFPVPDGEGVVVRGHARGGGLQGAGRGSNQNGTELQGAGRGSNQNGTELQGAGRGSNVNGTELQGAGRGSNLNGTELQGAGRGSNLNGTELQGAGRGSSMNGIDLQGTGRGSSLNGTWMQGASMGSQLNGGAMQGEYRGLGDLVGVRLTVEGEPGKAVTLSGGELVAPGYADTAALRGPGLRAITADGRALHLELAAVTLDGRMRRTELLVDGEPVCEAGTEGLFVAGRWDATGAHVADAGVVTYSCMTGVIAKCVGWGYAPWVAGEEAHAACTRMARADYCGDGTSWTLDGTVIDVFDRVGVKEPVGDERLQFEAAWGPDGATCVARTRYDIRDGEGNTIEPRCFAELPTCGGLGDVAAAGAVIGNSTYTPVIAACRE